MADDPHFVPLAFERVAESEQLARSRAFLDDLRRRRTVRDFSSEPVPFELVENAIATAGTTLTHTPSPMGFLREILERPENERAYVLVAVGYPATGCTVALERQALDEILVRR